MINALIQCVVHFWKRLDQIMWPFNILGIPPTDQREVIDRAYQALIGQRQFTDNREASARLTEAYKAAISGQYYVSEATLKNYVEKLKSYQQAEFRSANEQWQYDNHEENYAEFFSEFSQVVLERSPEDFAHWLSAQVLLQNYRQKEQFLDYLTGLWEAKPFPLHYEYFGVLMKFLEVQENNYHYMICQQLHFAWLFSATAERSQAKNRLKPYQQKCIQHLHEPYSLSHVLKATFPPWRAHAYRSFVQSLSAIYGDQLLSVVDQPKIHYWLGSVKSSEGNILLSLLSPILAVYWLFCLFFLLPIVLYPYFYFADGDWPSLFNVMRHSFAITGSISFFTVLIYIYLWITYPYHLMVSWKMRLFSISVVPALLGISLIAYIHLRYFSPDASFIDQNSAFSLGTVLAGIALFIAFFRLCHLRGSFQRVIYLLGAFPLLLVSAIFAYRYTGSGYYGVVLTAFVLWVVELRQHYAISYAYD